MTLSHCRVESDGPILTVTMCRPSRLNALSFEANEELSGIFDDFDASSDLLIAILTGEGTRAFSAGNDIRPDEDGRSGLPPKGFGGLTRRFDLDKPIIAAVNGLAVGGGFELALACDLIVASEAAEFGLVEPRMGLAALAGGIQALAHEIPMKQAMGLLLTGRRVSAAEGVRMGFVNELVPPERLLTAARGWADQVLQCAPLSIRATKQAVRAGRFKPGAAGHKAQYDCEAVQRMLKSEDRAEGARAFAQRRSPVWQGR